jgi:DNA topoisomerase-1
MSNKILVIVESPGKIAKIGQYLGSDYIVKASYGHVQDLDKNTLSIDVDDNFKPFYITTPDKVKVVKELKALAKDCSDVILAADGDREGEAIAHSLATVLGLKEPKRIIFHEITKSALLKALEKPITINYDMVYAQQARRLLDRLVGYKISPILWKYLSSGAKSAGRVQSVVVKIIIDRENEIIKSISESYFKTSSEFMFKETKLNAVLQYGNKMYQFETDELVKDFLSNINNKTIYKVISVENKKSIRKASSPFITSSLQQEASTKLHFNVKRTMDVAQKLYENGLITYMRSDSPNMSKDAIEDATKYIIKTFGKEYSDPKNFESKNSNSQDAHECIRPTHLEDPDPEGIDGDLKKLYTLIWKRTIASQMSNAQVNIQTIQIDLINNKESILIFKETQTYFVSILENVEFPGYLIVYDNSLEDEEKVIGKLAIKIKDKLDLQKITISEEYTKPPLRYNEAALVKYLEKNGIGRPSTYASIISKVIERNYVEIKNVDGVKKESKQIIFDSNYKIKEVMKEVFIGREQTKLIPTFMGNQVNDFMVKYFDPILDIEFTSNFESYLDKIAEGKANWITILRTFYNKFDPIVQKLNDEAINLKKLGGDVSDRLLGADSDNKKIYTGTGKYGPYIKIETDDSKKWKYTKLIEMSPDDATLEHALKLLEWPKKLGKIENAIVTLNDGPHGLYFKYNGKNYSIKNESLNTENITIDHAREIIEAGDPYAIKTFKVSNKILNIKKGEFGHYIQVITGTKKQNISIPAKYNIENIEIDQVLKIISDKNGTKLIKKN